MLSRRGALGLVAAGLMLGLQGTPTSLADSSPPAGAVVGVVSIVRDGAPKADRSGIAVFLEGVPGPAPQLPTMAMHQKDLAFVPWVLVVPKGSTVEFPNDDKVFHNVFSLSRGAKFDLGLYKSGDTKSVTFKEAGVVDVYCNIHPQMLAKIRVIDSFHYAITRADGSFRIQGVPPGTYPIVGWQPFGSEFRGEVTVTPGGVAKVDITLVEGEATQEHLRKDGTPYGRYK